MFPQLGVAGSNYARSVMPKHIQPAIRPDPSMMFDSESPWLVVWKPSVRICSFR